MAWFPLVGLIIGGLLVILDFAFSHIWPGLPGAALLLVAWLAISGGLHVDGFIDCCDGLLVAKPPEQRLSIMKDSRAGSFGVIGAVCLLLVKFSALAVLLPGQRATWLLVIPVLSRWIMVWAAWRYPTARPNGFAVWFRQGLGRVQATVAGALAFCLALAIAGWAGLALFGATWLVSLGVIGWVRRRIPGLTGDVYGALNELSEVAGLLLAIPLQTLMH